MAELPDRRKEQFARLLAAGMKQAEAYVKAGYRAADRSNASKAANAADVVTRVEELEAEETIRQARLKQERGDLSGLEELKKAISGASAAGNWAAVVSGAKVLGDADGSLEALGAEASHRPLTIRQMLDQAREISPIMWLAVAEALMLWDGENNRPMPPWTDSANRPVPPYLRADGRTLVLVDE